MNEYGNGYADGEFAFCGKLYYTVKRRNVQ